MLSTNARTGTRREEMDVFEFLVPSLTGSHSSKIQWTQHAACKSETTANPCPRWNNQTIASRSNLLVGEGVGGGGEYEFQNI